MIFLGYIAAILMGLSLGAIGGGGSILTVPILVYLFQISPVNATGYSLLVVGTTALVGGISYLRKGQIMLKAGAIFAIPSFLGVSLSRKVIVPNLSDPVFSFLGEPISKSLLMMTVFAILMISASLSMIKAKPPSELVHRILNARRMIFIALEGLLVGVITGFVGAGGGFLIIPSLVFLVGIPMKQAVGTSLLIIAFNSLFGFLVGLGNIRVVPWVFLGSITLIGVVGLVAGMRFSAKVPERSLKKGFGWFVLLVGSLILVDQITKL